MIVNFSQPGSKEKMFLFKRVHTVVIHQQRLGTRVESSGGTDGS